MEAGIAEKKSIVKKSINVGEKSNGSIAELKQ